MASTNNDVERQMDTWANEATQQMGAICVRRQVLVDKFKCSPVSISTMTTWCKTKVEGLPESRIDLSLLHQGLALHAPSLTILGCPLHVKPRATSTTRRGRVIQNFHNQVTTWVTDATSTKNIKIFSNGSLHITGSKSMEQSWRIAEAMCTLIQHVLGVPMAPLSCDVQMINSNFSINARIMLAELFRLLKDRQQGFHVFFTPESYAGLKFKLWCHSSRRHATILVFDTGNIIMTGLKHFSEMREAFHFVTTLLYTHWDSIFVKYNLVEYQTAPDAVHRKARRSPRSKQYQKVMSQIEATSKEIVRQQNELANFVKKLDSKKQELQGELQKMDQVRAATVANIGLLNRKKQSIQQLR